MKSSTMITNLFAAAAVALPSSPHGSEGSTNSLQARDTPLWAANFADAVDSVGAGFGRVQ